MPVKSAAGGIRSCLLAFDNPNYLPGHQQRASLKRFLGENCLSDHVPIFAEYISPVGLWALGSVPG